MKGRTKKYDKGDMTDSRDFTTRELIDALFSVEDLMERCLCPFVLLDETARQVREEAKNLQPYLDLNEISVGVRKPHLADSVKSMIKTVMPQAEWTPNTITYQHNNVPVVIWIIQKDNEVFARPDKIWFYTTDLYIPNPFQVYWHNRDILLA